MNLIRHLAPSIALFAALALSGCDDDQNDASAAHDQTVAKAESRLDEKFATQNIDVGNGELPKAEITPQGDLLIGGTATAVTPEQRKLLLEYRGRIQSVAKAGMNMGMQGADLAGKAVSESIKGVLNGDTSQIEKKVKAEAGKIESSVAQLCDLLPPILDSQQKLAASLPAFKPYATMTQRDVERCHYEVGGSTFTFDNDSSHDNGKSAASSGDDSDAEDKDMNAAEEADAASDEAGK